MSQMSELKEKIIEVLINNEKNSIDLTVEEIMKEIHKYDNSCSMSFDALNEEITVLKEEKKIVINRNVEMQRKLECIEFILGGRQ